MLTVLFVDDDASILNGLRRALRSQRSSWDMHFTGSGEDAIRLTEQVEFDVVVTDARMPGMDGPSLLEYLRGEAPAMVRILLSGETGEIPALRASEVAHQFLAKPCEPLDLVAAVERARVLRSTLTDPALRAFVGGVSTLPATASAWSVLGALSPEQTVDPVAVAAAVSDHFGLAAKVLAVVNSAFFGLARRVSDLTEAASALSPDVLSALARASQTFEDVPSSEVPHLGVQEVRSRRVAELAHRIAPPPQAAAAYTAGLLAGVGRLVLSHPLAVSLDRPDPAAVASALLAVWSLPLPIVDAVANLRHPARGGEEFGISGAVHVADALTPACDGVEPTPLDLDFLEAAGVIGELDAWTDLSTVSGGV